MPAESSQQFTLPEHWTEEEARQLEDIVCPTTVGLLRDHDLLDVMGRPATDFLLSHSAYGALQASIQEAAKSCGSKDTELASWVQSSLAEYVTESSTAGGRASSAASKTISERVSSLRKKRGWKHIAEFVSHNGDTLAAISPELALTCRGYAQRDILRKTGNTADPIGEFIGSVREAVVTSDVEKEVFAENDIVCLIATFAGTADTNKLKAILQDKAKTLEGKQNRLSNTA